MGWAICPRPTWSWSWLRGRSQRWAPTMDTEGAFAEFLRTYTAVEHTDNDGEIHCTSHTTILYLSRGNFNIQQSNALITTRRGYDCSAENDFVCSMNIKASFWLPVQFSAVQISSVCCTLKLSYWVFRYQKVWRVSKEPLHTMLFFFSKVFFPNSWINNHTCMLCIVMVWSSKTRREELKRN